MKRDLPLIKRILNYIEAQGGAVNSTLVKLHCNTNGVCASEEDIHQLWLLVDGGFLDATELESWGESDYVLTWSGHNLLEKLNAGHSIW